MTEPGYPPPGDLYGGAPPPPPMPPGGAAVPPLPWEDRERRGFFPALFETVKLFVTSPTEAFARAKESGDYLSPILFSVLIGWVATAIGQLYGLLFQGAWLSMLPPEMRDQLGPMMATGGASFILTLILAPVLLLIWFFIWSGIVHLFLMMLGGHKQSSSGFEGTFRAVSYGYVRLEPGAAGDRPGPHAPHQHGQGGGRGAAAARALLRLRRGRVRALPRRDHVGDQRDELAAARRRCPPAGSSDSSGARWRRRWSRSRRWRPASPPRCRPARSSS
jgi:hypothetical protein